MKSLTNILIIVISIFLLQGCGKKESNADSNDKKLQEQGSAEADAKINLPTMQCGTCKKNIENAVRKVDGVEKYQVDKKEKILYVNFDKTKTDISKIESAITAAGYDADDKKADPEAYKNLEDCCKLPKDRVNKDVQGEH